MKERYTMSKNEARSIYDAVIGAESMGHACDLLKVILPGRKQFSYWLGQIGRRQDVGLGQGMDYAKYLETVVTRMRSASSSTNVSTDEPEINERREINDPLIEESESTQETIENASLPTHAISSSPTVSSSEADAEEDPNENRSEPTAQPTMSRVQDYAIRNMLVFADCSVQKDESGVFDVLARNLQDKYMVNYWLFKVGYGHLQKYSINKDLIDYIRVISRAIHREIKKTVGKPIARW